MKTITIFYFILVLLMSCNHSIQDSSKLKLSELNMDDTNVMEKESFKSDSLIKKALVFNIIDSICVISRGQGMLLGSDSISIEKQGMVYYLVEKGKRISDEGFTMVHDVKAMNKANPLFSGFNYWINEGVLNVSFEQERLYYSGGKLISDKQFNFKIDNIEIKFSDQSYAKGENWVIFTTVNSINSLDLSLLINSEIEIELIKSKIDSKRDYKGVLYYKYENPTNKFDYFSNNFCFIEEGNK